MIGEIKQLIKERLLHPHVLCRSHDVSGAVCLTFDDGPHPKCTPRILDILDQAQVKATFFCVGERIARYPDIAERARAAGHELANHSMTHAEFARLDLAGIKAELDGVDTICGRDGNPLVTSRYVRPPKGVLNFWVLLHCIRAGRRIVLWNKDPEDFRARTAAEVLQYFDRNPIKAGDVLLLHDRVDSTVSALPDILRRINAIGLRTATVSQLFGARVAITTGHTEEECRN